MFHVPKYGAALDKLAAARGVETGFGTELVAVDGPRRRATFRDTQTGAGRVLFRASESRRRSLPEEGASFRAG
jgi:hypothetical protein